MTFKQWLEKENKTVADVARDLNLTHCVVRTWAETDRVPSKENMAKIIAYTNGEVQPNDFYTDIQSHTL